MTLAGSAAGQTDELYPLLRRRLIVASTIPGVYFLFVFVFVSVLLGSMNSEEFEREGGWGRAVEFYTESLLSILATAGTAVLLWLRPPRTVRSLRQFEIAIFVVLVSFQLGAVVHWKTYGTLTHLPDGPAEFREAVVYRYLHWQQLAWFTIIILYGTIVPNTLRRNLLVSGTAAASPLLLFAVYAYWYQPLPLPVAHTVMLGLGVFQAIAVAIAVFSSSRIEYFRRRAAAARRLGQYVLMEKLGGGGMGEVYRAEHVLLRRPCALKTIRPEKASDPDMLRRFEREVQITATLTHPNTVQVFDYGHAADGTFYYVMEYLPGLTLEELVHQHGPLPPSRAGHFLRQVCGSLGEAHARGLTHRDIKPGNVMVCERGGVYDVTKVLDFGLVRVPKDDVAGGTLTREGIIAGTPAYMSPEQAGGEAGIDPRSDIYSVGAMAYFLLAGKPPFADRSAAKMVAAHLYELPAALPAGVPADLAAIVMRCLAKAPSERWPNAASLESALAGTLVETWSARDASAWWKSRSDATQPVHAAVSTEAWDAPGPAADIET